MSIDLNPTRVMTPTAEMVGWLKAFISEHASDMSAGEPARLWRDLLSGGEPQYITANKPNSVLWAETGISVAISVYGDDDPDLTEAEGRGAVLVSVLTEESPARFSHPDGCPKMSLILNDGEVYQDLDGNGNTASIAGTTLYAVRPEDINEDVVVFQREDDAEEYAGTFAAVGEDDMSLEYPGVERVRIQSQTDAIALIRARREGASA